MERRAVSGPQRTGSLPIITGRNVLGLLLIVVLLLSCSGLQVRSQRPQGVYHRVKSGETLSAIAKAYQVRLQDLAEINNISRPDQIEADSVIFIPDASQVLDDIITAVKAQTPRAHMAVEGATEKEARPEAAPP
ncbi:MAG: LysM domain-containing protein, partial [Thermodesulfobacteriota bacterium]